ncbi:PcfJ domain-containing protein [Chromohalobacter japonicus]|uniref:PcfJ domain-containing protein n=1 Tax=Chromohalobacter japonicus TaxID=223900 RepID=UPI001FF22760|nr:PcfJ domain-containing protein [Chromohalobacter japonicus]MCK0753573.1 PcfJ domain-containing protein [Chromohalobacter japonicus]
MAEPALANHRHDTPSADRSGSRPPMLGDPAFNRVYRRAKDWVIRQQVLRLYQKHHDRAGFVSIIICNLWRIDRSLSSPDVETFAWDVERDTWTPSPSHYQEWPLILLLPIHGTRSRDAALDDAFGILRLALYQVVKVAGYASLPKDADRHRRFLECFTVHFLARKTSRRRFGLDHSRLAAAMRALRKNLWTDVIDRQVLSLASSMVGFDNRLGLNDYLRCAANWTGLKQVATEHRNCIPLLEDINPQYWTRTDLFSRHLWVRGQRRTTVVDRSGFMRREAQWHRHYLASLDSKADFRWLMQAPVSVVGKLKEGVKRSTHRDAMTRWVRLLRRALPQQPVPVLAIHVATNYLSHLSVEADTDQRLLRAWFLECRRLWHDQGYRHFRMAMRSPGLGQQLRNTLDWLRHEGRQAGLPDKHMNWAAIERRSEEWHERVIAQQDASAPHYSWDAPLTRIEADGFVAEALVDTASLRREGRRMRHCVGSYDAQCAEGHYLVYHLSAADDEFGERATLGLALDGQQRWALEQIQGPCGRPLSQALRRFAFHVTTQVNAAITEREAA